MDKEPEPPDKNPLLTLIEADKFLNSSAPVNETRSKDYKSRKILSTPIFKHSGKQLPSNKTNQTLSKHKTQLLQNIVHADQSIVSNVVLNNINKNKTDTDQAMDSDHNNRLYTEKDPGPYLVHVESVTADPRSGMNLHPIRFGNFLYRNNLRNILEDGIKRVGRNRLAIYFKVAEAANLFVTNELLIRNDYRAYIPTFNISKQGIVRGIPVEWSHEDIVNNIQIPTDFGGIIKSRRMSRKVASAEGSVWVPTQTVVLMFDGQKLPPYIYSFFTSIPVDQYIYPTVQCFNCCRFGHTRAKCRSQPRCFKCGDNHDGADCTVEEHYCLNCSGSHMCTNKVCPEYERQTKIKRHMSMNNSSYIEASKMFQPSKKLFSEVVSTAPTTHSNHPVSDFPSKSFSYTKTVIRKTKPHIPLQKGFDKVAHNNLIKEYDMPTSGNGCVLKNKSESTKNSDDEDIKELLATLMNIISNSCLPDHVALKLINDITLSIYNHLKHGSSSPVEL